MQDLHPEPVEACIPQDLWQDHPARDVEPRRDQSSGPFHHSKLLLGLHPA